MQRLPENLKNKIISFEKKLLFTETSITISSSILSIALPFLILFISDRIFDTSKITRTILAACALSLSSMYIFNWLDKWVFRRRSYSNIAIIIQKKFKSLGDKLQGAVELASEENKNLYSEELRQAALLQIAKETEKLDFLKAIDRKKTRKFVILSLVILIITGLIAKFATPAFFNSFKRLIIPFSNTQRFTFVIPEQIPEKLIVPIEENFNLTIQLSKSTISKPQTGVAELLGNKVSSKKISDKYTFNFPGISNQSLISLRIGDWRKKITVIPVYRTSPIEIYADIIYPEYIGKNDKNPISGSKIRVLANSKLTVSGKYSRPLNSIKAELDNKILPSEINKNFFSTSEISAPQNTSELILCAKDNYGLEQKPPTILKIESIEDALPQVELSGIPHTSAIITKDVLELQLFANDDFGLKYAALEFSILKKNNNSDWEIERKFRKTFPLNSNTQTQTFKQHFLFSPDSESIDPGKLIIIKMLAKDFRPNSPESFSDEKCIYILTPEEHFKILSERLKELLDKMQSLKYSENENLQNNIKVSESDSKKLQDLNEEVLQILQNETTNKEYTSQIANETANILKEAFKNPLFSDETASQWIEILSGLHELQENDFPKSCKTLKNAVEKSQRKNELSNAQKIQSEIVKKLDDLINQSESAISEAMAANFAARLKKEAENEKKLQSQLEDTIKISAGINIKNLTPEIINLLEKHNSTNSNISSNVLEIKSDLKAVYKRRPLQTYQIILSDMENEKIEKVFSQNQNLIAENKLYEALVKCRHLEEKLTEWAELIEELSKSKSQLESNQKLKVPTEVIAALMRALIKETQLRKKTKELNAEKEKQNYGENCSNLSNEQNLIKNILEKTKNKAIQKIPELIKTLDKITKPMTDAENLLKKMKTDAETVAAETEAVELISELLSGISKENATTAVIAKAITGTTPGFGMTSDSDSENINVLGEQFSPETFEKENQKVLKYTNFELPQRYRTFYETYLKKIRE